MGWCILVAKILMCVIRECVLQKYCKMYVFVCAEFLSDLHIYYLRGCGDVQYDKETNRYYVVPVCTGNGSK